CRLSFGTGGLGGDCYCFNYDMFGRMPQTLYFHISLEPHHKHSGSRTGRRIRFIAEVPVSAAKKTARSPDDERSTYEEAERLDSILILMTMSRQHIQLGDGE